MLRLLDLGFTLTLGFPIKLDLPYNLEYMCLQYNELLGTILPFLVNKFYLPLRINLKGINIPKDMIGNLTTFTHLGFYGIGISNIDISNSTKLTYLSLYGNSLTNNVVKFIANLIKYNLLDLLKNRF